MNSKIRDLSLLFSLDCTSDSLFPRLEAPNKERIKIKSRSFLITHFKKIDHSAIKISDQKKSRADSEFISYLSRSCGNFAGNYINRYIQKINHGFFIENELPEIFAEKAKQTKEKILSINVENEVESKVLDIVCSIDEYISTHCHRDNPIQDDLSGCLSEAESEWDCSILNLLDDEYDQPYISTIILSLNQQRGMGFLNTWRSSLGPEDYEYIRELFIKYMKIETNDLFPDIERFIVPL